jgi:diadenosine tetraphosphatase ApaH/serine/threonine PP2A family protein phosphatase
MAHTVQLIPQTPLHRAAYQSNLILLQRLVSSPFNANELDSDNRSLLFYACRSPTPSFELIQYLLEEGANPNIRSTSQKTPAYLLIESLVETFGSTRDFECIKDDVSDAAFAALSIRAKLLRDILQVLLSRGADLICNIQGSTATHEYRSRCLSGKNQFQKKALEPLTKFFKSLLIRPSMTAASDDGRARRHSRQSIEIYLATHPQVAAASKLCDDAPSASMVVRGHLGRPDEFDVDIGSVRVAANSWRGCRVDKASCAFKLATYFISRFQKVCLDSTVPVASHEFTRWLSQSAHSRELVGSDSQLRDIMASFIGEADPHDCLFLSALACLARECTRLLKSQPMLVRTYGHTKVYGDIHGQLADLMALFREHGFPSNRSGGDIELCSYIFDGDFVDRGPQQVEVVLLLLSLKVAFPDRIVLVRGNHEFKDVNVDYPDGPGFKSVCEHHDLFRSHGQFAFDLIHDVFDWLPFAALVEEKVLVVHGGIGDGHWADRAGVTDIDWLCKLECRPVKDEIFLHDTPRDKTLMNIVWSDPINSDAGERPAGWQPHYRQGQRGTDILSFDSQVTEEFCVRNKISMILRGHEVAKKGYEMMHSGRLCTVFSARNYCGRHNNDAALVLLQPDADGHVQIKFKTLHHI